MRISSVATFPSLERKIPKMIHARETFVCRKRSDLFDLLQRGLHCVHLLILDIEGEIREGWMGKRKRAKPRSRSIGWWREKRTMTDKKLDHRTAKTDWKWARERLGKTPKPNLKNTTQDKKAKAKQPRPDRTRQPRKGRKR
jgi:hypothetical protein